MKFSARGATSALILFFLCTPFVLRAADAAAKPQPDERLSRLIAHIQPQPLAMFGSADPKSLPERFSKTYLSQMLQDPSYGQGRDTLKALINQKAGADIPALWPDFSRLLSGPLVVAMVPSKNEDHSAPPFTLALYALVPNQTNAEKLHDLWPKLPPQNPAFFASTQLITVLEADLAPATPQTPPAPACDVFLKLRPKALGAALRGWTGAGGDSVALDNLAIILSEVHDESVDSLLLASTFNGNYFDEELSVDVALPPAQSSLARIVSVLKEKPANWNAIRAATPGEQDLVVLLQTDPTALGEDTSSFGQSLERDLRGKRWTRTHGKADEALSPQRYDALAAMLQGTVAIVARPAISGDLRVTMAGALKNGGDIEMVRDGLKGELSKMGSEFDTLTGARKIGDCSPLGAKFEGRGVFGSPIIGLSPGWAWLCSNLGTYQDLTAAFKSRRTLSADNWKDTEEPWQPQDAVRMQIQLERVMKIAYAAWLLSGEEGPSIGPWKIPGDMLPQPQVFNNRLGVFQGSLLRTEKGVGSRTHSPVPLMPLVMFAGVLEMADRLESAKTWTKNAKEDKVLKKLDAVDDKPGAKP